ncbi:MAG: hypothetical protein Q8Q41_00345 [bacterium]|nr:hypothetical protein [bacterium]
MTIIRPHTIISFRAFFEFAAYALLGTLVLYGVWQYNAVVNSAHEIETQGKTLEKSRVLNSELKNQLFSRLDSSRLKALAQERNLIEERQPKYFASDPQWLSALR